MQKKCKVWMAVLSLLLCCKKTSHLSLQYIPLRREIVQTYVITQRKCRYLNDANKMIHATKTLQTGMLIDHVSSFTKSYLLCHL